MIGEHERSAEAPTRPSRIVKPAPKAQPERFSWDEARRTLATLPEHGLNIAHAALDRHVAAGRGRRAAIRWRGKQGATQTLTYADLAERTNRFANVLEQLGVGRGDTVCSLVGRLPELYVAALGTLKHHAVFCPLFSAFGPEPIEARMVAGRARVLVTTRRLYEKKIAPIRDRLPALAHVLVTDDDAPAGTRSFGELLGTASPHYAIGRSSGNDPALLHFTSGTTGKPKGAMHVHEAVVAHYLTGLCALDLRPDDVFWCTADPGWVTGTSYGIIAPLVCGVTMFVDEAEFDAKRWYENLQDQHITVWYTAPTAIRMLMKAGAGLAHEYELSPLRFIGSVGEPLNPEAVYWGLDAFGMPIHDNWWQTETGGIMIANVASLDVKPGSMGRPLPGIEAAIVRRREDGRLDVIDEPDCEGELALRPGWPSMFRGYLDAPERYAACFVDGWYLSGDLARRDGDGYFWFVGRADDVIKSAGHLIGPFEVESVLMEHHAVSEAGVIGKPDEVAGAVVKAFVAVKPGVVPDEALRKELLGFARTRLGSAVAPREIEFVADLPKTRSGKIMRRLLKARELGLPEGDVSTLEAFG